jgi:protein-tyrosine phosphatase
MAKPVNILFLCTANYYRSRFAEMYFNHLAEKVRIAARADSAGLEMREWRSFNPGKLSVHTVAALEHLGIEVPRPYREPKQFMPDLLESFARCIALSDSEHRPMATKHFPEVVDEFEFWTVEDLEFESAESALGRIMKNVQALVDELR